jgi:hypothetical protein
MTLQEKLNETIAIKKEWRVIGIYIKDKNILSELTDIMVWNKYRKSINDENIIAVGIKGKYDGIPIFLDETIKDDICVEFTYDKSK